MKPHNYWKTKRILSLFVKYSLWVFGILILLLKFISFIPLDFDTISSIISIVSFIIAILWGRFEKKWWKIDFINKHLPDNYTTPVIEGRWEGILTRNGEKRDFVLEISQTFTMVSCKTYSKTSFSHSIYAELLFSEDNSAHQLTYLWTGKSSNTNDESSSTNYFYGFTILDINMENKSLSGNYFTDRQPDQTRGELFLKFRQKQLKNSYD